MTNKRRANYEIIEDTFARILIEDIGPWDEHPSVTNDAEAVVADMLPRLFGRKLHYIDSNGNIDELLVKNGKFAGFAPVSQTVIDDDDYRSPESWN